LILGSFVAEAALENGHIAREFAQRALLMAPNDSWVYNNLAVALIYEGKLQEGEAYAHRFSLDQLSDGARVVHTATRGLLAYRRGEHDDGMDLYLAAAQMDAAKQDRALLAMIFWHLLREESRIGSPGVEELAERLWKYTSNLPIPEIQALKENVMEHVVARRKEGRAPANSARPDTGLGVHAVGERIQEFFEED
jgi:hypothetical protein